MSPLILDTHMIRIVNKRKPKAEIKHYKNTGNRDCYSQANGNFTTGSLNAEATEVESTSSKVETQERGKRERGGRRLYATVDTLAQKPKRYNKTS